MPKVKDITQTQFYKVYEILNEHEHLTVDQIHRLTNFPLPSIRRVVSELTAAGRLEGMYVYRLK